jgi:hypothetical protein
MWKMLDLQHQYNNCTTIPHMRVGPTYWGPPSCERLLYSCCIGVVQESNPGSCVGPILLCLDVVLLLCSVSVLIIYPKIKLLMEKVHITLQTITLLSMSSLKLPIVSISSPKLPKKKIMVILSFC